MSEHYIVTVDERRLRVFTETLGPSQFRPRLELVESIDFATTPASQASQPSLEPSSDSATDHLLRRPGQRSSRKASNREHIAVLAAELNMFLQQRPRASWDFSATPEVFRIVAKELSLEARRRLKRLLSEDLARQNAEDVRARFALTV